jgi:hypothetical protein
MKNRGKIYLLRGKDRWRMADDEPEGEVTGAQFEGFFRELDSFVGGFFFALGRADLPAYAQGDFFGERTEAIHFTDRGSLTPAFIRAVQRWLSAERRQPWRVLIVGAKWDDNYIVIYHDAVVTAPSIRSLDAAIAENGKWG